MTQYKILDLQTKDVKEALTEIPLLKEHMGNMLHVLDDVLTTAKRAQRQHPEIDYTSDINALSKAHSGLNTLYLRMIYVQQMPKPGPRPSSTKAKSASRASSTRSPLSPFDMEMDSLLALRDHDPHMALSSEQEEQHKQAVKEGRAAKYVPGMTPEEVASTWEGVDLEQMFKDAQALRDPSSPPTDYNESEKAEETLARGSPK